MDSRVCLREMKDGSNLFPTFKKYQSYKFIWCPRASQQIFLWALNKFAIHKSYFLTNLMLLEGYFKIPILLWNPYTWRQEKKCSKWSKIKCFFFVLSFKSGPGKTFWNCMLVGTRRLSSAVKRTLQKLDESSREWVRVILDYPCFCPVSTPIISPLFDVLFSGVIVLFSLG